MNTMTKALLGLMIAGALAFAAYHILDSKNANKLAPIKSGAYFSEQDILQLKQGISCDSIRFYNAKYPNSTSPESVIAIASYQEADAGNEYFLFQKLRWNGSKILRLNKEQAQAICQNLNGTSYSASFGLDQIEKVLDTEGVEGIAVTGLTITGNQKTMRIIGALVKGRKVLSPILAHSIVDAKPCPLSCGVNRDQKYLCH